MVNDVFELIEIREQLEDKINITDNLERSIKLKENELINITEQL